MEEPSQSEILYDGDFIDLTDDIQVEGDLDEDVVLVAPTEPSPTELQESTTVGSILHETLTQFPPTTTNQATGLTYKSIPSKTIFLPTDINNFSTNKDVKVVSVSPHMKSTNNPTNKQVVRPVKNVGNPNELRSKENSQLKIITNVVSSNGCKNNTNQTSAVTVVETSTGSVTSSQQVTNKGIKISTVWTNSEVASKSITTPAPSVKNVHTSSNNVSGKARNALSTEISEFFEKISAGNKAISSTANQENSPASKKAKTIVITRETLTKFNIELPDHIINKKMAIPITKKFYEELENKLKGDVICVNDDPQSKIVEKEVVVTTEELPKSLTDTPKDSSSKKTNILKTYSSSGGLPKVGIPRRISASFLLNTIPERFITSQTNPTVVDKTSSASTTVQETLLPLKTIKDTSSVSPKTQTQRPRPPLNSSVLQKETVRRQSTGIKSATPRKILPNPITSVSDMKQSIRQALASSTPKPPVSSHTTTSHQTNGTTAPKKSLQTQPTGSKSSVEVAEKEPTLETTDDTRVNIQSGQVLIIDEQQYLVQSASDEDGNVVLVPLIQTPVTTSNVTPSNLPYLAYIPVERADALGTAHTDSNNVMLLTDDSGSIYSVLPALTTFDATESVPEVPTGQNRTVQETSTKKDSQTPSQTQTTDSHQLKLTIQKKLKQICRKEQEEYLKNPPIVIEDDPLPPAPQRPATTEPDPLQSESVVKIDKSPTPQVLNKSLIKPVDIKKILNFPKRVSIKARRNKLPRIFDRCGVKTSKKISRDPLERGFTVCEQRKPCCVGVLKGIISVHRRSITKHAKVVEKLTEEIVRSNNFEAVFVSPSPSELTEDFYPEIIKCEPEESVIVEPPDPSDIKEFKPTVEPQPKPVEENNLPLENILQGHDRSSVPAEALKLIQQGLDLIRNWSKDTENVTEKEKQQAIPGDQTNEETRIKRGRKRKSDRSKTRIVKKKKKWDLKIKIGRKRKTQMEENPENNKVPKKRGRKKKETVPPKQDALLETENKEMPKKRGRKKKQIVPPKEDALLESGIAEMPKKRGRKKKQTVPPKEGSLPEAGNKEAPKKRGRKKKQMVPPKEGSLPEAGNKEVPKKRGRKKKQTVPPKEDALSEGELLLVKKVDVLNTNFTVIETKYNPEKKTVGRKPKNQ